jgi:holo-[acyl-carrier protein] synthase
MILGLGNDITEIDRIKKSIQEHGTRFVRRILAVEEEQYCSQYKEPYPHYAARFSAKESIAKAFGVGIGKVFSWLDIQIINNSLGKPEVFFSEKIKAKFQNPTVLISISHSKDYVVTVALWIK